MTNDELKEIEARANAATPGPWDSASIFIALEDSEQTRGENSKHDSTFIAHARTDIPALIQAVRERDAGIGRLRDALRAAYKILKEISNVNYFTPGPGFMTPVEKCQLMAKECSKWVDEALEADGKGDGTT